MLAVLYIFFRALSQFIFTSQTYARAHSLQAPLVKAIGVNDRQYSIIDRYQGSSFFESVLSQTNSLY